MDRLNLILTLAAKDWRLFWADRRAALLCFAVPVVLASAFGLIFARPTQEKSATRLPVLIVVEDSGPFTRMVADDLLASSRLEAVEVATRAEANQRIAERRPGVAIVLPQGFEALKHWEPGIAAPRPRVDVLHHPTASAERQWAEGVLTDLVMHRTAKEAFRDAPGDEAALALPFEVAAAAVTGSSGARFNSYSHSFSGMTLQYLLFWGMESGLLFLRERQRGVWMRMRSAPVPLWSMIAGKALTTAAVALLMVLVTFGVGHLAFGVAITGSFLGFLLIALAASALASTVGLLVAAIGGTEARARGVSILVILGISMIGGLWLPAFLLPGWLRDMALSLPTTWAMRGLDGVTWQGHGFIAALPSVLAISGFALIFLGIALVRLTQMERRLRRGMA